MKNLQFDPMSFVENLKWMGIGLLGIFMIIGIIIAATYAIGYVTKVIANNKNNSEN